MSETPVLPVPTADQTTQGLRLYTTLAMTVQMYQDWFTQGIPREWGSALDQIQRVLTRCKREAAQCDTERTQLGTDASAGEERG